MICILLGQCLGLHEVIEPFVQPNHRTAAGNWVRLPELVARLAVRRDLGAGVAPALRLDLGATDHRPAPLEDGLLVPRLRGFGTGFSGSLRESFHHLLVGPDGLLAVEVRARVSHGCI